MKLDDDDYYVLNYAEMMVSYLGNHDFVTLSNWYGYSAKDNFFTYWDTTANSPYHYMLFPDKEATLVSSEGFGPSFGEENSWGYGFSYVFKKSVYPNAHFHDQNFRSDASFILELRASDFKMHCVPDETGLTLHTIHTQNVSCMFPQYRLPEFLLPVIFGNRIHEFLAVLRSEVLKQKSSAQHLSDTLTALEKVLDLARQGDWGQYADRAAEHFPECQNRYGRMGFTTSSTHWRPGIFFGFLYNGTDHGVELTAPQDGPDFCLILSFDLNDPEIAGYDKHPAYGKLIERLRTNPPPLDFEFLNQLENSQNKPPNQWHPIHLRKNIKLLFNDQQSPAEQAAIIRESAMQLLGYLFADGELDAMKKDFEIANENFSGHAVPGNES